MRIFQQFNKISYACIIQIVTTLYAFINTFCHSNPTKLKLIFMCIIFASICSFNCTRQFSLELIFYLFYSINTTRNLLHWMCMICVQSRVPMGYVGARGIHLKCDANEKENDRNFPPVGIPTNCSIELLKMYYFGLTMYEHWTWTVYPTLRSLLFYFYLFTSSTEESFGVSGEILLLAMISIDASFQLTITLSWLHDFYRLITFNVL